MDEQNLEGQLTLFPDNADYDAFTEKFKPKRLKSSIMQLKKA